MTAPTAELLDRVVALAWRASARVLEVYATPFEVELKGPDDPVTRADREVNTLLVEALAAEDPAAGVLAEESAPSNPDEILARARRERVWFVDPLDGTREFAARNGEFAVMIGLAVRGRATLGVVAVPVENVVYAGLVGDEPGSSLAFAERRDGGAATRAPIAVSTIADPAGATLVVSRSHRPRLVDAFKAHVGLEREIPCGSVGVKIARIVTRTADLYLHGGGGAKLWDTCAPEAILRAAGGRMTDLDGAPIDYASGRLPLDRGIVATNGPLHAAALAGAAHVATLVETARTTRPARGERA